MSLNLCLVFLTVLVALDRPAWAESPFASSVIDYSAAPGQFVNDTRFTDGRQALGPPRGEGTSDGNKTSIVTLGGFGGSITLGFDHTVENDPLNPFGMDAVVFGNAIWVGGDPQRRFAEAATIEIGLDTNGNGWPDEDEPWYLIPGSHIPDPAGQFLIVTWDDDIADTTYPPAVASWVPPGFTGMWTTQAFELPVDLFGSLVVVNPSLDATVEGVFGYPDYSPTLVLGDLDADNMVEDPLIAPEDFYTVPDDPFRVGITPGSGGGDAFDMAWAVDPSTGRRINLPGFDFIRITTAVNAVDLQFGLGEKSAEIDAVADVKPDPRGDADNDGDIDLADLSGLQRCFGFSTPGAVLCDRLDHQPDGKVDDQDTAFIVGRMTGPR